MKMGTISASDVSYLVKKSVDALSRHPWINTESDAKCALYTYIYSAMSILLAYSIMVPERPPHGCPKPG